MKLNQDKCHLLISGHKYESMWANIGYCKIWKSNGQNLLGVVIERHFKFSHYIFNMCRKAGRKLSAITRFSKLMSLERRIDLMKSFIFY